MCSSSSSNRVKSKRKDKQAKKKHNIIHTGGKAKQKQPPKLKRICALLSKLVPGPSRAGVRCACMKEETTLPSPEHPRGREKGWRCSILCFWMAFLCTNVVVVVKMVQKALPSRFLCDFMGRDCWRNLPFPDIPNLFLFGISLFTFPLLTQTLAREFLFAGLQPRQNWGKNRYA